MSLAGLKKQINKANQYVSERVGAAEPTKLDDEYNEMERKIDVTNELVEDLITKTREYLQPNPAWLSSLPLGVGAGAGAASRAKMQTVHTISKIRGTNQSMAYPQPEGLLGESMQRHGKRLGDESVFGKALVDAADAFKNMADVKYALEDTVKQNFLDPLTLLQNKDLKEVNHHRKKLMGRRLDYDCKKRQQKKDRALYDEELRVAEEKLEESKQLAETAMFNVLDNDVEQVSQLCALVEAQIDFHKQTEQILEGLKETLKRRVHEASTRSRPQHLPRPVLEGGSLRSRSKSPLPSPGGGSGASKPSNGVSSRASSQDPWGMGTDDHTGWQQPPPAYNAVANNPPTQGQGRRQPCAKVMYDFDAENPGELALKEGQTVNLISQIDENWYEGSLPNGKGGFFPISYVEIVVPL